eukprot:EG_transcript_14928
MASYHDAGGVLGRYKPDWQCVACGHVNFARRFVCESCRTDRTPDAPAAYAPNHAAVREGLVAPTNQGPARSPTSAPPSRAALSGRGPPMQIAHVPAVLLPGDWCCPRTTCGALNGAQSRTCYACRTPKDYDGPESALASLRPPPSRDPRRDTHPSHRDHLPTSASAPLPPSHYPPDWKCLTCENTNFARRAECKRCGAARTADCPETRLGLEFKPDWRCVYCSNINFARRGECKQCGKERTADAPDAYAPTHVAVKSAGPNGFKPGDWSCRCGYVNFARRNDCGKCSAPRPPSSSARFAPY